MTRRTEHRRPSASFNVAIGAAGTFVTATALFGLLSETPAPMPHLRGTLSLDMPVAPRDFRSLSPIVPADRSIR